MFNDPGRNYSYRLKKINTKTQWIMLHNIVQLNNTISIES